MALGRVVIIHLMYYLSTLLWLILCNDMIVCLTVCRCIAPELSETERETEDKLRADRSLFTQQLILSTLCISDDSSDSDEKS